MSVSPSQNSAKPSPVPGPSTVAAMPEQSRSFSPTAAEMGSTVEEPETFTSPSTSVGQSPFGRGRVAVGGRAVVVITAGGGDEAEGEEQGQARGTASS